MQNKIYVGNLSYSATAEAVQEYFSTFGAITDVAIPTDAYTKKPRGFAFVTFEEDASAQKALEADGQEFMGRNLKVNIAKERERNGGGRGNHNSHGQRQY